MQAETEDVSASLSSDAACRVCRGPASSEQPLFYPCQCKGSIRWVHQDCLLDWLQHSRLKSCELCKHQFRFTPIYAPNAPERLSMFALFAALWRRWGSSSVRALRAALVLHIWVIAVPLLSAIIARFYLARLPPMSVLMSHTWLVRETLLGMGLVATILGLYMALTHLVRYLRLLRLERQIMLPQPAPPDADEELVFDLFDAPPGHGAVAGGEGGEAEEGELDDLLGLAGPWHRLVSAAFYVVAFNAGVLALLLLIPNLLGLAALLLWHKDSTPLANGHSDVLKLSAGYAILTLMLLLVGVVTTALPSARNSPPLRAARAVIELLGVATKVGALLVAELVVFPIFCGTLLLRAGSPLVASPLDVPLIPGSVPEIIAKWLFGITYMIGVGAGVRALRDALRPGSLWFLRNPETAAVLRDMIELPMWRHARRLAISSVFYFVLVGAQLWLPALLLSHSWPLPGAVLTGSFMLPLLQLDTSRWYYGLLIGSHLVTPYVLPTLRPAIGTFLHTTTVALCSVTGLGPYLLPTDAPQPEAKHVPHFAKRLFALLVLTTASLTNLTLMFFSVLLIGKCLIAVCSSPDWIHGNDVPAFLIGLYLVSALLHVGALVRRVTPIPSFGKTALVATKVCVAALVWGVMLPLVVGTALDRVLRPMRFRSASTSVHVLGHTWLLGIVWVKIWARVVLITRPGRFRPVLERVLNDGFTHLSLTHLFTALILPVAASASLFLSLPYLLCAVLLPLFTRNLYVQATVGQLSHVSLAALLATVYVARQLRSWLVVLHEEVRNERYLVGAALHNYPDEQPQPQPQAQPQAQAQPQPQPQAQAQASPDVHDPPAQPVRQAEEVPAH